MRAPIPWPFAARHAALNLERGGPALLHAEICCPDELIPDHNVGADFSWAKFGYPGLVIIL